jgi:hypothetical protein
MLVGPNQRDVTVVNRRVWLGWAGALAWPRARAEEASALLGPNMPYEAFDRQPFEAMPVPGGRLRVVFGPGQPVLPRERILAYVRQSARAVATYFGRFPAADTRVLVLFTDAPGRPVRSGQAFGHRGAAIKLTLGLKAGEADLEDDWVLVHEMSHLALPSLPRRQHWFEEGMATYVEPIARVQAGALSAERIWADMLRDMHQGLPQAGDRGLDDTPTWGRTYWGGALFCLLADVEMRERSGNRKGLQHALRAIMAHGNMEEDSELPPLLAIGDQAVGAPVLQELYAQMKGSPHAVDLPALWKKLGVGVAAEGAQFDDRAPLAAVRRALTQPPGEG